MNFPRDPLPPQSTAAPGSSSSSSVRVYSSAPPPNVMHLLSAQRPDPSAVAAAAAAAAASSMPMHPPQPAAKKSSKSARKRKSTEPSSAAVSAGVSQQQQPAVRHKSVREAVLHLLSYKAEEFTDVEFAERALLNLARKVSSDRPEDGMADWERCVRQGDASTPCVAVVRPKDGRMTVAKPNVAGTKKVFPQIIVCQTFRWPSIVFHNDIASTEQCSFASAVKPHEGQEGRADHICINPYHYQLTMEARNRFNKTLESGVSKKGKDFNAGGPPMPAQSSTKKKASTRKSRSKTEEKAPGEVIDFDDKGTDYIKLWDERAEGGDDEDSGIQTFDEEVLLNEIKFLNLKKAPIGQKNEEDLKHMCDIDEEVERQKLRRQLRPILTGEYLKKTPENTAPVSGTGSDNGLQNPARTASSSSNPAEHKSVLLTSQETLPQPPPPAESAASDAMHDAAEDSVIQDLLDDIRGSFERQFDDEFEELSAEDIQAAADGVAATDVVVNPGDRACGPRSSGPGGPTTGVGASDTSGPPALPFNMDPTFPSVNLDSFQSVMPSGGSNPPQSSNVPQHQQQQQFSSAVFDQQQQQQGPGEEMPCIVNSWTVGDGSSAGGNSNVAGGAGAADAYLGHDSLGTDVLDNFFSSQPIGGSSVTDASMLMGHHPQQRQQMQQNVYAQQFDFPPQGVNSGQHQDQQQQQQYQPY